MARRRGAKLTSDALRELSFLKSGPEEDDLFDFDFDISKTADAEDGSVLIEGYVNTPRLDDDLDGDIVEPNAFQQDLEHFMRHPVIRREHKSPIGRVTRVEFRPEGPFFEGVVTHDAPGEQTRDMIKKKVLRGISARFQVNPRRVKQDVELLPKDQGRLRIKRARLVEVTITDVPRNSGGHFKIKENARAAFAKSLSAGSGKPQEENDMKFIEMLARLLSDAGYKCDAENEVSMMKALGDCISAGKGLASLALIAKSLGQPESASADQILEAVKTASSKDGMVAKSVHDDLQKKFDETAVELLLLQHAERITPANKEFAKSLAVSNRGMFDQWIKTQAPVPEKRIPGGGNKGTEDKEIPGVVKLSDEDFTLAKSFGAIRDKEGNFDQKRFEKLVNMKPCEISSELFGTTVSETVYDKAYSQRYTEPWLAEAE